MVSQWEQREERSWTSDLHLASLLPTVRAQPGDGEAAVMAAMGPEGGSDPGQLARDPLMLSLLDHQGWSKTCFSKAASDTFQ